VWIDLGGERFGTPGTPEPQKVESQWCVRFENWGAERRRHD
jgi:hypothetical protein